MNYDASIPVLLEQFPGWNGIPLTNSKMSPGPQQDEWRAIVCAQASELQRVPMSVEEIYQFVKMVSKSYPIHWRQWEELFLKFNTWNHARGLESITRSFECLMFAWLALVKGEDIPGLEGAAFKQRARSVMGTIEMICFPDRRPRGDADPESYFSSVHDPNVSVATIDVTFYRAKTAEVELRNRTKSARHGWPGPEETSHEIRGSSTIPRFKLASFLQCIEDKLPLTWPEWGEAFDVWNATKERREHPSDCWVLWLNLIAGPEHSPHAKKAREIEIMIRKKRANRPMSSIPGKVKAGNSPERIPMPMGIFGLQQVEPSRMTTRSAGRQQELTVLPTRSTRPAAASIKKAPSATKQVARPLSQISSKPTPSAAKQAAMPKTEKTAAKEQTLLANAKRKRDAMASAAASGSSKDAKSIKRASSKPKPKVTVLLSDSESSSDSDSSTSPPPPPPRKRAPIIVSSSSPSASSSDSDSLRTPPPKRKKSTPSSSTSTNFVSSKLYDETQKGLMADNFKLAEKIGMLKCDKKALKGRNRELEDENARLKKELKAERRKGRV